MKLYFTGIDPPAATILEAVRRKGWRVAHHPFRKAVFLEPNPPDHSGYDAWLITSKRTAQWLLKQKLAPPPLAVVGETSAALLHGFRLLFPETVPSNAKSLVAALKSRFPNGGRFLFLKGETALNTVPDGLAEYKLDQLVVYRTEKLEKIHTDYDGGMVYFQAPSMVTDFLERYGGAPEWTGAIGETTARAIQQLGWDVHFRPSRPEMRYLIEEIPDPETLEARFRNR